MKESFKTYNTVINKARSIFTFVILFSLLKFNVGFSQSISPTVINSAGGTGASGSMQIQFNIGEPIVQTGIDNQSAYTQGFVQPSYDTTFSVLTVLVNAVNESCLDANDGSIALNILGVKGNIQIIWSHTIQSTNLLTNLPPGTYSVLVNDSLANGQIISYNNGQPLQITILDNTEPCPVDPVNSFTPNGDGKNDFFTIEGIENYPINEVFIFNRWGNKIWQTTNYSIQNNWNGKDANGNEINAGTYFFIIKLSNSQTLKGWVEVLK